MSPEMGDVIDRVIAALNAADLEAFVSCYAVSATIEDGDDVLLARGREEIQARYRQMFADFPNLHVEPHGKWQVGQYVIQDEQATGRAPIAERHVAIYHVVNDQIARERLLR